MAELCCEIIQTIFNEFELNELLPYFKYSIKSLADQEQTSVLQQITSIAFLKEFIYKYWKNYVQEDNSLSKSLIGEINNYMSISHLFIQSLQSYFVPNLYQENFFNNTKQFEFHNNHESGTLYHFIYFSLYMLKKLTGVILLAV